MIRSMLLGVGFLAWSLGAIASKPYIEHKYQYTQPNGDVVTIILNGDDYFGEQHSLTGELVMYDPTVGGMVYAEVNADRTQLISTGELVKSHDFDPYSGRYIRRRGLTPPKKEEESSENEKEKMGEETQQQSLILKTREQELQERAAQISGSVKGLTLIIQFPDQTGNMTQAQVDNFLNGTNYSEFGNATSVRGYFSNISNGQLDYSNTVTQYYTANHNKAYYTDDNFNSTVRSRELITEALNWLENSQNFDFSTLSTDANGKIIGLNILYAGGIDSSWDKGLWPHMGKLIPSFCADGVCTDKYQISNMGEQLELGPFVHETAHQLFHWPDLFDYDGSSYGSVAGFGLMGLGVAETETKLNPVQPNGYFRSLAGWLSAIELNPQPNPNAVSGTLTHNTNDSFIYRWSNPSNPGEAFYLESVQQTGQNQQMPSSGLAIWHINPDGNNNDETLPFVQLEHADGNRDPENKVNTGDAADLFTSGLFDFNAPNTSETNSRWVDGTDSSLIVKDISINGDAASFTVGNEEQQTNHYNYTGYISHQDVNIEPNGSWFYTYGGNFTFELEGSAYTDFDLYLQYWNGQQWTYIAASQSYASSESIQYNLTAGYYRLLVHAYHGSGYYEVTIY
jgi:M6 family metalloprotease-like protein